MNRLALAGYVLASALLVVFAVDVGVRHWNDRGYIVTGYSMAGTATHPGDPDQFIETVTFTIPGGRTGEVRLAGQWDVPAARCFGRAEIGKAMPACLRSYDATDGDTGSR